MEVFRMPGHPHHRQSHPEPANAAPACQSVGRRVDALAEINTANECFLFLLSSMFGADSPCRVPGRPCARIHDVMVFLRRHFAREEKVMRDAAYPDAKTHAAEHEVMLARLASMYRHLQCGRHDPRLVLDFLESWAVAHIEDHDKPLGRFLVSREAAAGTSPIDGSNLGRARIDPH